MGVGRRQGGSRSFKKVSAIAGYRLEITIRKMLVIKTADVLARNVTHIV